MSNKVVEKWVIYNIHYIASSQTKEFFNIVAKNMKDAVRIAEYIQETEDGIIRIASIKEDRGVLKYNI